jgi:hypothetical protein
MIFKLLPFLIALGVGLRFLASFLALNAQRKRLKAEREGRLEQYYANKERFWRRVDRVCTVLAVAAAAWYAVGVYLWLFEG